MDTNGGRIEAESEGECYLLEIPGEIIERILRKLEPKDLVAASQACRMLREAAKSPRLTYRYALAMRGYLDVPNRPAPAPWSPAGEDVEASPHTGKPRVSIPSVVLPRWPETPAPKVELTHLSAAEKQRLLRDREERFDRLSPAQVREFAVAGPAGVYELQDGVFLLCHERSTSHDVRPTKIRLIPLASATDPDLDSPILPCKEVDTGFPIADLTMDPSQDLIVVSEHAPAGVDGRVRPVHRFHLLTLSDGQPHPLAAKPTLDSPPWSDPSARHISQQLLQVMDSTLVILVAVQDEELAPRGAYHEEMFAWNWRTGVLLSRLEIGETLSRSSIALLTPTTVSVTMPAVVGPTLREMFGGVPGFMDNHNPVLINPPTINIYSFASDPAHPPPEDTGQLRRDAEDKTTPRFVELAKLHLPTMVHGTMMSVMHMRPDPAFPVVPGSQATLGTRPFTQDPRRGVIVIELMMDDDRLVMPMRMSPENYEMFILRETLVDMAEEGEERQRAIWARKAASKGPGSPISPRGSPGVSTPGRAGTPSSPSGPSSPHTPSSSRSNSLPSYATNPRRRANPNSPLRQYEWDEWGEYSTRIMRPTQAMRRLWVCSCSGYRYASLQRRRTGIDRFSTDLNVLDFNPRWFAGTRLRPDPEAAFGASQTKSSSGLDGQREDKDEDEEGTDDEGSDGWSQTSESLHHDNGVGSLNAMVFGGLGEEYADILEQVGARKAHREMRGAKQEAEEGKEKEAEDAAHKLAFAGCSVESYGPGEPSVIDTDVFADPVTTRLPFRSVSRKLRDNPKGVMIDDQRILIVQHSIRNNDWLGMVQYISTWCM